MPESLIFYNLSLFSIIMLSIILVVTQIKKDIFSFSSTLFLRIIILNIAGLFFEGFTWFFDGRSGRFAFMMAHITNFLLILTGTILMGLWTSYVDYKLYFNKRRIQQFMFYQIPTFIIFFFLIVNLFIPVFFSIDSQTNLWSAAPFMFLRYILTYVLYFRVLYLVIKSKNSNNHRIISGIMFFMVIPLIGIVLQLIYPMFLLTWSFLALAIIIVYIFLETISGNRDYLTNVYSRNLLETYIHNLIEDHKDFHVIMMDMDHFKEVNDIYGHHVGDRVLIEFAKSLSNGYSQKEVFVARLGGDEFFTVLQYHPDQNPEFYIQSVTENMQNNIYLQQFKFLSFSSGYITYDHKMSMDDLLNKVDQKMYAEKEKHHTRNTSK
jgi:diguanylate cyclase (GGDEF)-like protein